MTLRSSLLTLAAALLAVGLAAAGRRVLELERAELEYESEPLSLQQRARQPGATRVSARLGDLVLNAGDHALFELCAADPLSAPRWAGKLTVAIFHLEPLSLMLKVPLDQAHLARAKRGRGGACVLLGRGPIEQAGRYSIDAVWPDAAPPEALTEVPLHVRVLASTPLGDRDYGLLLLLAGAMGLALAAAFPGQAPGESRHRTDAQTQGRSSLPQWLRRLPREMTALGRAEHASAGRGAVLLAGLSLLCLVIATQLPLFGPSLALVKGSLLMALQVGLSFVLIRHADPRPRALGLGLQRPPHAIVWLVLAGMAGALLLPAAARISQAVVPSTGEAPIQSFIAWPSGMLAFGSLGMLLPVAEEVFFRGYLYRLALRWGKAAAVVGPLLLFVALHAQQSWGNWGGLLAIFLTGVVLTALRAFSGSALVPAIAHLLYNCTLSLLSF